MVKEEPVYVLDGLTASRRQPQQQQQLVGQQRWALIRQQSQKVLRKGKAGATHKVEPKLKEHQERVVSPTLRPFEWPTPALTKSQIMDSLLRTKVKVRSTSPSSQHNLWAHHPCPGKLGADGGRCSRVAHPRVNHLRYSFRQAFDSRVMSMTDEDDDREQEVEQEEDD
jgi:hypothetical protein